MLLAPDEALAAIYRLVEPHLAEGTALGFSHGLAIRFGFIVPRPDLDVYMVAPKGPGTALRSLYQQGQGMVALLRSQGRQRQRPTNCPSLWAGTRLQPSRTSALHFCRGMRSRPVQ
jgi:ketol-acid reductoisomerase